MQFMNGWGGHSDQSRLAIYSPGAFAFFQREKHPCHALLVWHFVSSS